MGDQMLDLREGPGSRVGLTDTMPSFSAIKMPIVNKMIEVIRTVDNIPPNVQFKYLSTFSEEPAILYQSIIGKVKQRQISFTANDLHFQKIFKSQTEMFVAWLNHFLMEKT